MVRIKYPDAFTGWQTLLTNILAKHTELGAKSPLVVLFKQQKIDFKTLEASVGLAAAQNTDSVKLRMNSEEDTQERDALLEQPWAHLLGEVQFLKYLFTVLPGKEFGMIKGYSRITVTNPSTLSVAQIQVTVSK